MLTQYLHRLGYSRKINLFIIFNKKLSIYIEFVICFFESSIPTLRIFQSNIIQNQVASCSPFSCMSHTASMEISAGETPEIREA